MTAPLVRLDQVSFAYDSGPVLSCIDLELHRGDFMVLLGANGSGKSTLVKVAVGLLEPQSGRVELFGRDPHDPHARERVGYVPQRTVISRRVPATVAEVVAAGRARSPLGFFARADRAAARDALGRCGLDGLESRRVGELSGGQQQRVLIARALAASPDLLVLDEPTAGVDRASQVQFAEVLRELHRDGVTIVMVAHDLGPVGGDVTRVVVLHQGHIDERPPEEIREQVGLYVEDHAHGREDGH